MKLIKITLTTIVGLLSLNACGTKTPGNATQPQSEENMNAIIVYFTHSGNTELAAKDISAVTGAKMIRLIPEQPYTADDVDWVNEQSRCTQEHLNQSLRPALKPIDINLSEVDTLFIGFPIWWHEEPAVIRTFLDNYHKQLEGKVLYPFCTSYESPMSEADETLRKGYPHLNWKNGLRLPAKPGQINQWIKQ